MIKLPPIHALLTTFLVLAAFAGSASGQNLLDQISAFRNNAPVQTAPPNLERNFDELISRADRAGAVKVIVGYRIEKFHPDAQLSGFEQTAQRAAIKRQQISLLDRLSSFGVANLKQFEFIPFLAMETSAEALTALREMPEITSIQEDAEQTTSLLQSVPLIGAVTAWNAGFTGQGRTVAVLDTGVDKTHPFFNGRVVSEACYSTNSATTSSFCPGGVTQTTASNSGLHCDINQIESCFHGTHVAGIVGGGHPQINGAGVARNANLIAIQVFSRSTDCGQNPAPCTTAFTSDTIRGLERVYALRTTYTIDAVNLSLGGGRYFGNCDSEQAAYKSIIDTLRAAGIATVVASGNDGYTDSIASPACVSSAISVGSTHDGTVSIVDTVSDFSNSAIFLHLLAPGELITSAYPGGSYHDTQGTSMAAPHVAGAWAVLKQKFPSDSVTQIFTRLKYSGVPVYDTRNAVTKPRIRLDVALNTSNVDPCGTVSPITFGQTVNGSLSNTDCLMNFGSRADIYSFSGTQGQSVAVALNSSAFNTYLYLVSAGGAIVGENNDGGGGTNSRVPQTSGFLQLPATGTYYIYATSFFPNVFGNYAVTLTTSAPTCNFTISSSSQNFNAAGGSGSFTVNAPAGCAWTAQSSAAWLTTNASGSGNGTINYTVVQNASAAQRAATITAGGQIHTVTQAGAAQTTRRAPADFDGDGKTDVSIFRPSAGEWWYQHSSNGSGGALSFGVSTDRVVPGDYTGDGKTDIAFWRPSTGQWFVLRSENFTFYAFPFGASGDKPVPADYDGDGKTDPAVFRPSSSTWFINKSTGGTTITTFGAATDLPVVADYDGDRSADVAIFRPNGAAGAEWWGQRSSNGQVFSLQFGSSTDKAVPGDYTGDGRADIAFWRPTNGNWYVLRSEDFSFYAFPFGASGDRPVAGDYDGDGRFDPAVFRASNVTWYVNRSSAGAMFVQFGASGDTPVPGAFVP